MKQAQIDPMEFDRAIDCQLPEWRRLYENAKLLDGISNEKKKKAVIKDLKEVHDFLTRVSPLFRIDRRIPVMEIKINGGFHKVRLTDLLGNGLLWVMDWLNNKRPKSGPHASNGVVTQAAYELSEMSREFRGRGEKTDWKWVNKKIQESFPDVGHHEHPWIRDRVKKFRKGRLSKYWEAGDLRPFSLSPEEKTVPAVPATVDSLNSFFMRLAITTSSSVIKNWRKRPLKGKRRTVKRLDIPARRDPRKVLDRRVASAK